MVADESIIAISFNTRRDMLTRLPHMTNRQFPAVTPDAWAKADRTTAPAKAS